MAKRYVDAFDETEDRYTTEIEDIEAVFESDDEEYESEQEEQVPLIEEKPDHADRIAALNAKYSDSLSECYETIKDKLTWVNVQPLNTNASMKSIMSDEEAFVTPKPKRNGRFNPTTNRSMSIPVKYGTPCGLNIKPPRSEESVQSVNNRLCKFVLNGVECPYKNNCKFSHTKRRSAARPTEKPIDRMTTAEGKTKRIWMCRSFVKTNTCRYGDDCAYAHNADQVKDAVSICGRGNMCRRVKLTDGGYVNIGEVKCMRLHPKEVIANFISRTS